MPVIQTDTIDVPGATLHFDVREAEAASGAPPLLLIGSPMDASGFGTLASHFTDRTVITYDPRGVTRSVKDDPTSASTPEQHAEDLSRVIDAAGAGPVDIFASSGGAVNALALVAAHPEQVRTLVAHEPPAAQTVPDREQALAAVVTTSERYRREGTGAGMGAFMGLVMHAGEFPADWTPAPPPPGMPIGEDDGRRDDPLLAQNLISCTHYEPDFDALRAAPRGSSSRRARRAGDAGQPRGACGRGAARDGGGRLPQRPCRLPRRRVRHDGRARRLRREAPRGPRRRASEPEAPQSVRPVRTLSGRSAATSAPRRASASSIFTRIQFLPSVRVSAKQPRSLCPCNSTTRWPSRSRASSNSPSSQMITVGPS